MAREAAPTIIFMDEIDSIGSARQDGGQGGDSEVQRTMLELLAQLDGFEATQNIKVGDTTHRTAHGLATPTVVAAAVFVLTARGWVCA